VDRNGAATVFGDWHEHVDTEALVQTEETVDQLALEVFPQTAQQTLEDWEATFELDQPSADEAVRQAHATAAGRAALTLTPANLRAALDEYLNSQYGFWDHGDEDISSHYLVQEGNGSVVSGATGLILSGTAPAQLDWEAGTAAQAEVLIVDRDDAFVLEAEMQAYVVGAQSAAGLYIRDGANKLFIGVENTGAGARIMARKLQDGTWTTLNDIAVVGAQAWYQIERDADGLYHCRAGTSLSALADVQLDIALTWRPRRWGVASRNFTPWPTVSGRWQDLRIAYATSRNNIELHEKRKDQLPAGTEETIFVAFVHRDPLDSGVYDIEGAQRLLDRITWGHTVILVGESGNFLTDDPGSLTDRDILGA
jgi:hypothetical protein